jgi:hypothetical protein
MRIHISYTTLINPPSASPTLTRPQIWAGLQRKIRHAEEFVPVITSCKVLSEEAGVVTRQIQFDAQRIPPSEPAQAKEVVRCYSPYWVRILNRWGACLRMRGRRGCGGEKIFGRGFHFVIPE